MRPLGTLHRKPMAIGFQTAFEHPLGFPFLGGYGTDDLLVQTSADGLGLDVGGEAVLIFDLLDIIDNFSLLLCHNKR